MCGGSCLAFLQPVCWAFFLLGIASRRAKNAEAVIAVIIGVLVIAWMTFPTMIPENLSYLRSTFNTNMVIVIGTLTIFLTGTLISLIRKEKPGVGEGAAH